MSEFIVQSRHIDDIIVYEVIKRNGTGTNTPLLAYFDLNMARALAAHMNKLIPHEYEMPANNN